MRKKAGNHYLEFTLKERRGIYVFSALIIILTSIPFFYPLVFNEKTIQQVEFEDAIEELVVAADSNTYERRAFPDRYRKQYSTKKAYRDEVEFEFDPNTISAAGWHKLGISDKTIGTIQRYISKGGRFRKPADLQNIWGIQQEDLQRLLPYVRIVDQGISKEYPGKEQKNNFIPAVIDINNADSTGLINLPGIGSKLSKRIISFREKLGGFYSVEQVSEIFGLPDSVFQIIRPLLSVNGEVKKININTASLEEMKAHPYIRYNLANVIIQYRTQNGPFNSVSDVKKIMIVTDEIYNKVFPYLGIE